MAAEIQFTPTTARGVLDACLDIAIDVQSAGAHVRIGNWTTLIKQSTDSTIAEMRRITYAAIARYREQSQNGL